MNDFKVKYIDETDGLRITLVCGDIIHFRPSGNAPELCCYAESASESIVKKLVRDSLFKIKDLSNDD